MINCDKLLQFYIKYDNITLCEICKPLSSILERKNFIMFAQPKVECSVNAIYKVAKLKEEVAYTDFNHDVLRLYNAVKGNKPENIILKYDEKMGKDENERPIYRQFSMSLKEIGRKELCKTIRAVAATAACIFMRRNDVDSETILKIY